MDDEIINWNLKGPKRMKKRKELNALLKSKTYGFTNHNSNNTSNYCNLSKNRKYHSTIELLSRFTSSSDDLDGKLYFSANKALLKRFGFFFWKILDEK
jgi:hypothetical protein